MLTISTGIFNALDIGEAIVTQKYWVSINYIGVGRFAVAIGSDVSWGLKERNVKKVREVYENIKRQTFKKADADIYKRIGDDMDLQMDKFGLSLEQTTILYNLEYYKTLNKSYQNSDNRRFCQRTESCMAEGLVKVYF